MARRKPMQVKEDLTCNLIPMVDIMFLLLLFFILGADMSQREQAELVLPTASEIKEADKVKGEDVTTTVNIQHRPESQTFSCPINKGSGVCRDNDHWLFLIQGSEYTLETLKPKLEEVAQASMEEVVDPEAGELLSARKVIIRADKAAPYGHVQKIIEFCGLVKIYKIEVGAAVPPAG